MIKSTHLSLRNYYYPVGNSAVVSLTQDLPPEQDADILLLGCGDARNILFTCFTDNARKMDVTCCDIEPAIHARNVLLYSLLMEDEVNRNVDLIWNIYYHWNLDKESSKLLEAQALKLLQVSKSIDQWHSSVYGSIIRFCDERSLCLVTSHWKGYQLRKLSHFERVERLNQMQAVLNSAIARRKQLFRKGCVTSDTRMASPVGEMALVDVSDITARWWDCGTTRSKSKFIGEPSNLNPAFLYSPDKKLDLHYSLSPIECIPLCTAYVPISRGTAFHREDCKSASSTKHLTDCAKFHFRQWAAAFRRAVQNKLVIRIFAGDALAFCCTLRNSQLTLPSCTKSMNLFCDSWTNSRLELHHSDYSSGANAAPLNFDVIETSNLIDHLGPLNVITAAVNLLKYHASSTLYTQTFIKRDSNPADQLFGIFNVDTRSLSLLLGLMLPDLFTNAIDSVQDEDNCDIDKFLKSMSITSTNTKLQASVHLRLRWKRLRECLESSIHVEAEALAKFLVQVYNEMLTTVYPWYNVSSFAMLLNVLRATIVSDWDKCVRFIYDSISSNCFPRSISLCHSTDLALNMQLFGVYHSFNKPTLDDVSSAILAPILPFFSNDDIPELLCVTVRVSRKELGVFTSKDPEKMGSPALACIFEGGDPGGVSWLHYFLTVQIVFGTRREQAQDDGSCLYIDEDRSHLFGTSDMFASVMVPTCMLLRSKHSVPLAKCGLVPTWQNFSIFKEELGVDLCFACSEMTSKDVFITRYMPGMPGLPTFMLNAQSDKPTQATFTVQFTRDGSKVDKLIYRVLIESQAMKAKFAIKSSTVEVKFQSPMTAIVSIAQSHKLKVEFPIPVSPSKYKVKIARKSSYIEVESPLFDPLAEDASSFLFPVSIAKAYSKVTIPILWTSTRINLDVMPPIDLKDKCILSSISNHAFVMFSERELHVQMSNKNIDVRTNIKTVVFTILFEYLGITGERHKVFVIREEPGNIQTLIIPSCLRLDLVNRTIVLDTVMVPLTDIMHKDPRICQLFQELSTCSFSRILLNQAENRAWKAMMPALVERCRTWKHNPDCEYIQAGEAPLSEGLSGNSVSPICSCGIGKFPPGEYLNRQEKKFSDLSYMINKYATRAAIAPIFALPYVENLLPKGLPFNDSSFENFLEEGKCTNCGRNKRKNVQAGEQTLLRCARCKRVQYCSGECQKADWKNHKPFCSAA